MSRSPSSSSSSSSRIAAVVLAAAIAFTGCKKSGTEATGGSGSSATTAGSSVGSGSASGSAGGSGSALAGAGSGSDSAGAGSGTSMAIDPGPRPPSVTPEIMAVVDKAMATVDAFMTDLGAVGTDCAKATEVAKKHMATIAAIDEETKQVAKIDLAGQEWLAKVQAEKVSAAIKKGDPTMNACRTDPGFVEVMSQLKL